MHDGTTNNLHECIEYKIDGVVAPKLLEVVVVINELLDLSKRNKIINVFYLDFEIAYGSSQLKV